MNSKATKANGLLPALFAIRIRRSLYAAMCGYADRKTSEDAWEDMIQVRRRLLQMVYNSTGMLTGLTVDDKAQLLADLQGASMARIGMNPLQDQEK